MLPGINSRLNIELNGLQQKQLKNEKMRFPFFIPDRLPRYPAYVGAKLLSTIYSQKYIGYYWITKNDWEEYGSNILNKKVGLF